MLTFSAVPLQVPIEWEVVDVTPVKGPDGKMGIPQAAIDSVNRHKIGLKGPLMTPIGKGHRSLNLAIRKEFELYANVRPCRSLEGESNLTSFWIAWVTQMASMIYKVQLLY